MGVLIPADYDVRQIPDATERRVVENLRDRLTNSWRIIPRLDIAKENRPYEVDILIFHPDYGIAGIEVKGGSLHIRDGRWYRGSKMLEPSPPRQAQNACMTLRNTLRELHSCMYNIHVNYAVAMLHCKDFGETPLDALRQQLMFQENMEHIGKAVLDLMKWHGQFQPLSPQQMELFLRTVRPTIPFVWDPEAEARDARVALNLIMREQVRALSTLDMNQKVLVHGAAGTGKTQLALQWATRAIERGERVLLTCYNIPLGQHLQELRIDEENIVVGNFVDVLSRIPGLPVLQESADAKNEWFKNAPAEHLAAHVSAIAERFDTIIIDEVQDFYPEWLSAMPLLCSPDGPQRLLMVGDPSQDIFGRQALEAIADLRPTEAELLLNCRNTQHIGELLKKLGGAKVANVSPKGVGVFAIEVTLQAELLEAVGAELEDLVGQRSIDPTNVLIVTVNTTDRDAIRDAMPGGYNCTSWEDREDQNVVCETVQRTKGLEYDAVIFATTNTEVRDHLLYVGVSRAISILTVIAPAPVLQRLDLVE